MEKKNDSKTKIKQFSKNEKAKSSKEVKKLGNKNLSYIYKNMKNNYKDIMNKIFSGEYKKEKEIKEKMEKERKEREKEELEEYEKKGIKKEDLEEEIKFHNDIFNDLNKEKKDDINMTEEKKKIEFEKKNNPEKFIDPDENLKSDINTNELFPISVLAKSLEKSGISTAIEKKASNINVSQACLQMIFNGMSTKTKLDLKFDFGNKENKKLLSDEKSRKKFEESIINKIAEELNIPSSEIFFINPRDGSFEDTLVLPFDILDFNDILKLKILEILKPQKGFIQLEESALLDALLLTKDMLEPEFNKAENEWPTEKEYRGPIGKRYDYFPPHNWKGYALKVRGIYENDNWLTYQNTPGEWWIAYHGLGNPLVVRNILEESFKTGERHEFIDGHWENDLNHPGHSTRHGAYFTPIPEYAEFFAEEKHGIMINGENYIVAFMCRVNPETIMVREPAPCEWISPGTENDVRPYRILIKRYEPKGFEPAKKYRKMNFVIKED